MAAITKLNSIIPQEVYCDVQGVSELQLNKKVYRFMFQTEIGSTYIGIKLLELRNVDRELRRIEAVNRRPV